jgi:hypothetical protein
MTDKTLDEAIDDFAAAPTRCGAATLLTTVTQYWNDDMIGDESYAHQVRRVRDWLVRSADHGDDRSIADAARMIASYTDGTVRRPVYRVAIAELERRERSFAAILTGLGDIIKAIDSLPIEDDGTRRVPPGLLDGVREIAALGSAIPN